MKKFIILLFLSLFVSCSVASGDLRLFTGNYLRRV